MLSKMKQWGKAWLSKANFLLGRNPVIEQRTDFRKFIPEPYQTIVLISADFELAWAPRYDKHSDDPLALALRKARQERVNIPKILEVTERYDIPITWATVGHLLLESCKPKKSKKHPEIRPVPHYEGPYWDFQGDDWFEYDPCADFRSQPEWYAPDLVSLIRDHPLRHEIGCHTFSHIDCRDGVCPPDLLRSELRASKKAAAALGLEMRSFVHPGHTIGNLDVLAAEGFTNFRSNYRNVLGYPRRHPNGLWEFEQTGEFAFRQQWSTMYHSFRYTEIIKRAMQSNTLCVLWFHPSFDQRVITEVWPKVFAFIRQNRDAIWVTTHSTYVEFLDRQVR